MSEDNTEVVGTPEANLMDEQVKTWNLQSCKMAEVLFKELATLSAQDIYDIAGKKEGDGGSQALLNVVNSVFAQFIENGDGMPRVFFDGYERIVDDFVHTIKSNVKNKNEQNMEALLVMAVGKSASEMSYTDMINVLTEAVPEPVEEEVPGPLVEETPEPAVEEVKE